MKASGPQSDYATILPIMLLDRIGHGATTSQLVELITRDVTWGGLITHNHVLACLKDLEHQKLTQPPYDRTSDYTNWRWHVSYKGRLLSP